MKIPSRRNRRHTFSALCLEKPISRRVSRGLSEALWIFVGVGFFLGGRVAIFSLAFRVLWHPWKALVRAQRCHLAFIVLASGGGLVAELLWGR